MSDQESKKDFPEAAERGTKGSHLTGHFELDLPNPNEGTTSGEKNQKSFKRRLFNDLRKPRFYIEAFALIVVAIYTGFAGYQSCQLERSTIATKESADAAVAATRALIFLEAKPLFGGYGPYWAMGLQNVGKISATQIIETHEFKVTDNDNVVPNFPRCPEGNKLRLPYIRPDHPRMFAIAPPAGASQSPPTVWIHGCIRYRDFLSARQRLTEFCQSVVTGTPCQPNQVQ